MRHLVKLAPTLRLVCIALVLLFVLTYPALAQEEIPPPLDIQLTLDRVSLTQGETTQATLILRNTSPYTSTNVGAGLQGTGFTVANSASLPDRLAPHSGGQAGYALQSRSAGSHNIVFVVQCGWNDLDTGAARQWIEAVSVDNIEVAPRLAFDWPGYLIPLLVGLLAGLLSGLVSDWRKQRQEAYQREEQARGIVLAVLQATRRGVENEEKVSVCRLNDHKIVRDHPTKEHRRRRKGVA